MLSAMIRLTILIPISLAMLLLTACAGDPGDAAAPPADSGPSPITGTLNYRERIRLGPGATVEVRLLDVSIADVPATTLGIARITNPGPPPIDFRLEFDPENIDERRSYVNDVAANAQWFCHIDRHVHNEVDQVPGDQ